MPVLCVIVYTGNVKKEKVQMRRHEGERLDERKVG